jgi:hypothetical protein
MNEVPSCVNCPDQALDYLDENRLVCAECGYIYAWDTAEQEPPATPEEASAREKWFFHMD